MRKEVLLAILIGMSFGLLITFGIYHSRQNVSQEQKTQSQDVIKSQNNGHDQGENNQLLISSPEDELLSADTKLLVSGSTGASNFIVIFLNNQEFITTADASGNFSLELTLDEGANLIVIESLDEDGQSVQVERTVIVNAEFLERDFTQENNTIDGAENTDNND